MQKSRSRVQSDFARFLHGRQNRCANTVFCSRLCSRASKPGQVCEIKSTSRNQSLLITCALLTPRRRRRRLAPLPRPRQEQRPRQESLIVQNNGERPSLSAQFTRLPSRRKIRAALRASPDLQAAMRASAVAASGISPRVVEWRKCSWREQGALRGGGNSFRS